MVLIHDRILKIDIYNFEMSQITPEKSLKSNQIYSVVGAWNNGKEFPRWWVAEIQKMSPSTTGICSRHAAAVLSNKGVGTADQWKCSTATQQPIRRIYYICSPGLVSHSVFAVQAWSNL